LNIAIQAYFALGVYGRITHLSHLYNVSRLFVYQLLWQLEALFETGLWATSWEESEEKELDRLILLLRLQGRCSLGNISEILRQLGFSVYSVGYISERILAFARAIPLELPAGLQVTFYLSDEIYSGSRPILITVDAKSLAILKIQLAPCRDGQQWKAHWEALAKAGYVGNKYVVSDLGAGLVKGCALLGLVHHPDLFHLLRPMCLFVARFEKQAYAAIENEYHGERVFDSAKSERTLEKRLDQYEKARAESETAIERYDNFYYLWCELKRAFDLFDEAGNFKDPQQTLQEVRTLLELMKSLGCERLNQEIATVENALESYWGYFQRAETIYQELAQIYPEESLKAICLAWQYERQAKNSKNYQVQQYLKNEAQFYLDFAQEIDPVRFEEIKSNVFERFDANVRSSSLIENVNSSLRPFLESCRGQVTQETLNLVAYVHNHRRFVRGQRRNRAPVEILTGKPLDKSWIETLLESVH
jgi:hypothetical protein